jgi:DNA processing protein
VRLSQSLTERGALVSELPLGTGPRPEHFPRRNRLIAGWGRAVVVVEAAVRSGALVTARLALDEGRDVMAVPGHPGSLTAGGTNALIRDGAALVRDAADVLGELGLAVAARSDEAEAGLLAALTGTTRGASTRSRRRPAGRSRSCWPSWRRSRWKTRCAGCPAPST